MYNLPNAPLGNLILVLSGISWAVAQILKVIVVLIQKRKLDWRYVVSSGGMPSSHSAFVCTCASATGQLYGYSSPLFAIAAVLAIVVMYDASNVRRAAGEQAKILNYMMDHWMEMPPALFGKELKELLGHTPIQVVAGAFLGIAVGCCAYFF
ncbi:MAG: divergent PAP2 family protein [Clostridia bacterium]|nr:divergent PAP2 family protein [Clostridia bacterium]